MQGVANLLKNTLTRRSYQTVLHALKIFYISFMKQLKNFIEWQAFGVCAAIGERMGIATTRIRMWFIYISFLTLGSPVILYMIAAFWMNIKRYILAARRNPLRYL